ncbi:MAG: GtrA family protein [Myxococcota bacterium]|nr:GtrA family protein [Myxococcota bacterium]
MPDPSSPTEAVHSTRLTHRFLKFALVGLSGVFVNLGALAFFVWLGIHQAVASALAIQVSIISNFIVHDWWTFRDRRHGHGAIGRMMRFQGVSLVGAALQWFTFLGVSLALYRVMVGETAFQTYLGVGPANLIEQAVRIVKQPPAIGHQIYLAQLVGIGCATIWNFAANFLWTWRTRVS